jgi:transcription elongation factor GreB
MSKAFVKETDDEADLPDQLPAVPAGFKNYMTPGGHRRMQDELRQLLRVERPKVVETVAWAAGNGDRSENGDYIYGRRRLREIDRRIRFLTKRLESAEVVDPGQQKRLDQVFFGATVTYATEDGTENTITIVGIDEADFARGQVSWVSPIARALLKAQEGDTVELCAPAGVEQLECSKSATPPPMARHAEAPDPRALWRASPRAPRIGPLRHDQAARRLRQSARFRSRASGRPNPSSRHATANEQWPLRRPRLDGARC